LQNKITGANAGEPRQLPMRTRWAARAAQFVVRQQKKEQRMKYEYKVLSGNANADWSPVEKAINQLTASGWEVVSSNANSFGHFSFGCGTLYVLVTFVLRRPLQQ